MRMRTIIEAGRKASPRINSQIEYAFKLIEECLERVQDLSSVRSEGGRAAMVDLCAAGLDNVRMSIGSICHEWGDLDQKLRDYKYKFKKTKKELMEDLPGQQLLFEERGSSAPTSGHDAGR